MKANWEMLFKGPGSEGVRSRLMNLPCLRSVQIFTILSLEELARIGEFVDSWTPNSTFDTEEWCPRSFMGLLTGCYFYVFFYDFLKKMFNFWVSFG